MNLRLGSMLVLVLSGQAMAGSAPAAGGDGQLPALSCVHDGSGTLYEVGPGQTYTSIGAVPWESLGAGDTVRIHHRDEPYREKILIRRQGTVDQPIVVCGVPGAGGAQPVIDGQNATTRQTLGYRVVETEPRGLIHISWGAGDNYGFKPQHVVIQGLHLRNAFHEFSFTASDNSIRSYANNAAAIFVERGEHISVRGVTIEGNGNGFFVASGDSEEVLSRDIVLERSRLFGNGTVSVAFDRHHNIYTEAAGMLIQYNEIGPLRPGSGGSTLKDRSAGTVIRYNLIDGGARSLDLVEAQEGCPLLCVMPEYRSTFVYGNTIISNEATGPVNMIHYGGDSGLEDTYRKGRLHFFHNTVVIRANQTDRYRTVLFDASTEDEIVDARNNVVFARAETSGATATELSWMRTAGVLELGVNWASPGILDFRTGVATTGSVSGQGNVLSNAGNDPGFENEASDAFRPDSGSALLDQGQALHADALVAGHSVLAEYASVASGEPRTLDAFPDLGAFERSDRIYANGFEAMAAAKTQRWLKGGAPHPRQYLGKGPDAYDDGQRDACTGAAGAAPHVWCVRAGANPGGNGTQATPFASINAAIAAASAGDIVQVAAGTYSENVAIGAYVAPINKDLILRGGFNSDFSQRDASLFRSVIDGGNLGPGVQLHLDSSGTTVLDGFEITGGVGLGINFKDGYGAGGGVYVQRLGNGTTRVSHNEIHGNRTASHTVADTRGGGIHTYNQNYGGATGIVRLEDNDVHDNLAGKGAGINVTGREATLLRNRVEDNIGHNDHGGGIYVSTGETQVRDNAVIGNEIGATVGYGWGGGLLVAGASADLIGNVFTDNFAPSIGSGMFWDEGATGTMRNDLIFRNRCTNDGRQGTAIYVDGGAGPSIVSIENATIADHDCPGTSDTGGVIHLELFSEVHLRNSILWGNTREFGQDDTATVHTVAYSISAAAGTGNLNQDPRFANPAADDYHLRSSAGRYTPSGFVLDAQDSPAIDAGDPASDFSLESAPNGGRINLGAYGNTAQASRSPAQTRIFESGFESP